MAEIDTIQSVSDFETTPAGLAARWNIEIGGAKKEVRRWHSSSKKIVDRFLDRRMAEEESNTRVNLFSANIQTQRAMLYGKTPKADVVRRFEDGNDAVARVASLILERLLNTDIEDASDGYTNAIALALDDRLLVGLGNVRVRYEAEFEDQDEIPAQLDDQGNELAPSYTPEPKKVSEDVKVDYVHWRDQLWSPARTFSEVRWWAFRVYMTLDELKERFGEDLAKLVPMNSRGKARDRGLAGETQRNDPWSRAEVWEIWSKEDEKVYWWADGCPKILDEQDDPLELDGFWPFPKPMTANLTTDSFMPRPDFILAQDLYNEIDYVSTRITYLERAVKVVGVYDRSAEGIRRIMQEGFDNDLIPVENWALFAERGGLKGQVDWVPLDVVVIALDKLIAFRENLTQLLYEVTGLSDIMRGEQEKGETATTSAIKAKFASVRMQAAQDEFARFATDVLELKAQIICAHYDDAKILGESNLQFTFDAQLATQALQLLRDKSIKYRIEVKPENISMTDYDVMKSERMAFMQALTTLVQAGTPLMQSEPLAAPFLLDMLKWALGAFRGSSTIEGVLDQAITALKQKAAQPPPPQQPNPAVQAQQARAQADIAVSSVKARNEIQTAQVKHGIDQAKLQLAAQKAQIDLQKQAEQARLDAERVLNDRMVGTVLDPGQQP